MTALGLAAEGNSDIAIGINLGAQLGVSAALVVTMVLIHSAGIVAATRTLRLRDRDLRSHRVDFRAFGWLIAIALWLFILHMIEIAVFALFYMRITGIDLTTALFFSTSAYSTLGDTGASLPKQWELIGAMEGLIGFLMIGWSTAVFIADMNNLLRPPDCD